MFILKKLYKKAKFNREQQIKKPEITWIIIKINKKILYKKK